MPTPMCPENGNVEPQRPDAFEGQPAALVDRGVKSDGPSRGRAVEYFL